MKLGDRSSLPKFQFPFTFVLVFSAGICFLQIPNTDGSVQHILFFGGANCTGIVDRLNDTAENMNVTRAGGADSFIMNGLWKVFLSAPTGFFEIHPRHAGLLGACVNKADLLPVSNPDEYQIDTAVKYGPVDMTTPHITFFDMYLMDGERYEATLDVERFPDATGNGSLAILSVAYFSNVTWISYPEINYGGVPTCWVPTREDFGGNPIEPYDAFSLQDIANVTVGSVKMDRDGFCDDEDGEGGFGHVNFDFDFYNDEASFISDRESWAVLERRAEFESFK